MKKVMIVDDEFTIRELVEMTLDSDYEVIKAENGLDALQKIDGNMPDLIILDIMMPQMDGFEVCKKLKSDEKTKHIPIIMLTAKHELEDVKRAIKTDVDEYVTKPFEPELLRRRVEENFKARENNEEIKRKLFKYGKSLHYIKGRRPRPN